MNSELTIAIRAADETFDRDDSGNAKFREFITKVLQPRPEKPNFVEPQRPVGGVGYRYGVPL